MIYCWRHVYWPTWLSFLICPFLIANHKSLDISWTTPRRQKLCHNIIYLCVRFLHSSDIGWICRKAERLLGYILLLDKHEASARASNLEEIHLSSLAPKGLHVRYIIHHISQLSYLWFTFLVIFLVNIPPAHFYWIKLIFFSLIWFFISFFQVRTFKSVYGSHRLLSVDSSSVEGLNETE